MITIDINYQEKFRLMRLELDMSDELSIIQHSNRIVLGSQYTDNKCYPVVPTWKPNELCN